VQRANISIKQLVCCCTKNSLISVNKNNLNFSVLLYSHKI